MLRSFRKLRRNSVASSEDTPNDCDLYDPSAATDSVEEFEGLDELSELEASSPPAAAADAGIGGSAKAGAVWAEGESEGGRQRERRIAIIGAVLPAVQSTQAQNEPQRKSTVVAHTAPANFHHAAAHFCLRPADTSRWKRLLLVLTSFVLVVLQIFAVFALVRGSQGNSCASNADCTMRGTWCMLRNATSGGGMFGSCEPCDGAWAGVCSCCGSNVTQVFETWAAIVAKETKKRGVVHDKVLAVSDIRYICSNCVQAEYGAVFTDEIFISYFEETVSRVRKMMNGDWMVAVLAFVIVSLSVMDELQDIALCAVYRRQMHQSNAQVKLGNTLARASLSVISSMRRIFLLPIITACSVMLVVTTGSDAVSICMNTVATLFILEADNLLFEYGLDHNDTEEVRSTAQVALTPKLKGFLYVYKIIHFLLCNSSSLFFLVLIYKRQLNMSNTFFAIVFCFCSIFEAVHVMSVLLFQSFESVKERLVHVGSTLREPHYCTFMTQIARSSPPFSPCSF